VPFYFLLDTDISVFLQDNSVYPPNIRPLLLSDEYAVIGAGSGTGGSITLIPSLTFPIPSAQQKLTITRSVSFTQLREYVPNDPFPAASHEQALDKLTMGVQQLREQVDRAIKIPVTDSSTETQLADAATRAGKMLVFDANGNLSLMAPAPGRGVPGPQVAAGVVDGSNNVFTFLASSGSPPVPMVFAGGVFQTPSVDYLIPVVNVGGSVWQITFISAPINGPITVALFA
jgi:hypothetical protein